MLADLYAVTDFEALSRDLKTAYYFDQKLQQRFPETFNNLLSTGYFVTPSARMTVEGEFGVGLTSAPPYLNWNARVQPFPLLELSVNYRIFYGVEDAGLSPHGFGYYADRSANFKIALFTPEQSLNQYPGLSFGIEDFMGSKKFTTYFVVLTKVWEKPGLETSLGYGAGRYTNGPSKGFFGGFSWFPLWECGNSWIKDIGFAAEFDPIDYSNPEKEPNHNGRISHFPINYGARYQFKNLFQLAVGQIRGDAIVAQGAINFNFGKTMGIFNKTKDPPYCYKKAEQLACCTSEKMMIDGLKGVLENQGFQLRQLCMRGDELRIVVVNCKYIHEEHMRKRMERLLAANLPEGVENVTVVINSYAVNCQQYRYTRELLTRYVNCHISPVEFALLTPREDVFPYPVIPLYCKREKFWRGAAKPDYAAFLGNRSGKYKYAAGINLFAEGFLPLSIFYDAQMNYIFVSTMTNGGEQDYYNPSYLPNVATDLGAYVNQNALTFPKLYMQRSWNFGSGFFGRASWGYFQVNYAGLAGEALWYPAKSSCAIGIEGAIFKKRTYRGLGFQREVRYYTSEDSTVWRPYSLFEQYFLSLYLDFPQYQVYTKLSLGQFLAWDKGGRIEFWRYFDNGMRFGGWLTITDANDIMHGERYFNRGVALQIPLDFFYRRSCKEIYSTGMAAWLRDAGYYSSTGISIYDVINDERRL